MQKKIQEVSPYRNIGYRHAVKKQPRVRFKRRRPELAASLRYVRPVQGRRCVDELDNEFSIRTVVYNICCIIAIIFSSSSSYHSSVIEVACYGRQLPRTAELGARNAETSSIEAPPKWIRSEDFASGCSPPLTPPPPPAPPPDIPGRRACCRPAVRRYLRVSTAHAAACCRQCCRRRVMRPTSPSIITRTEWWWRTRQTTVIFAVGPGNAE